jgi:nucleotide-binding universal stress UspA family protein
VSDDGALLIAYDGSPSARAAIDQAARLFAPRRAIVVSVWSSVADVASASLLALPSDIARDAAAALDRESEQQAERLAEEGAELARAAGLDAQPAAARSIGNVCSTILAAADRDDASAIVAGSRGISGVRSLLLGSVSGALVHHSERPVLVVHPPKGLLGTPST